ncbi:MAG TPA: flavin monoamine oxidase family protein [Stellaceae bacterium]|nr:flavin monoamine oxidase family protein [Stellaceae bacterium]
MTDLDRPPMKRRDLLALIGAAAGGSVMYQAMTSLGHAAESNYRPLALDGNAKGASVLVLGAGLAGLVAAYELRKAGYKVQVLEYGERAGGRCWSLRGGDRYTELGGFAQTCAFDAGHYLNPGPWRIPFHHHAILDYCKRLKVALEPFIQVNYNAYLHAKGAFGGKPQRLRHVNADFSGGVAELLGKAAHQGKLDDAVSKEDQEILLEALRAWGGLDRNFAYTAGEAASARRGYDVDPGGGLNGAPTPSTPVGLSDILKSRLWQGIAQGAQYEFQTTMFQPKGGMDMIAKAFVREVGTLIRYDAKVTAIRQDDKRVTVTYVDAKKGGAKRQASADWCVCTIPLSILGQIEMTVGAKMAAAITAVPYVPAVKIGLQFKRRFWEEDEAIYGGITTTDLPIRNIGYPCADYGSPGKGVLLGCYAIFNTFAFEFGALPPAERVAKAVDWGAMIHPQYRDEFDSGVAVAWQRNPASLGCFANWSEEARKTHYADLCQIDGRIALAGEHASYLPAWQEGAILSSLDAVARLHRRVVAG